ncbi:MAG: DUF7146 domain-containing protein [Acetobacteraceae bacterium]
MSHSYNAAALPPQAREIAARLGLHRAGREWRGSCPCCGYSADAFSLTESKGRLLAWCASCQDRTAIAALLRGEGVPAEPRHTAPGRTAEQQAERQARARERAAALWAGASPVPGTPAEAYLATRHLTDLPTSPALRFRRDCPHPGGGTLPAMVALVTAPDGKPAGIHRTYLKPDGSGKADVAPQKATLGQIWTGAIRLAEAGPALVVGEGIETAAAAGRLTCRPAWCAISAGNLARAMALPPEVRDVLIATDNDAPGRRAAADAATRWRAEGRRVQFLLPRSAGADAADLLAEAAR